MKKKLKAIVKRLNRIEELLLRYSDANNQMQELQQTTNINSQIEDMRVLKSDNNKGGSCQCK